MFPFAPLAAAVEARGGPEAAYGYRPGPVRTFNRWKARGQLPDWAADRLAVDAGLHPWQVWGDTWWTSGRAA